MPVNSCRVFSGHIRQACMKCLHSCERTHLSVQSILQNQVDTDRNPDVKSRQRVKSETPAEMAWTLRIPGLRSHPWPKLLGSEDFAPLLQELILPREVGWNLINSGLLYGKIQRPFAKAVLTSIFCTNQAW